jgi:hypothetical protein
MREESMKKIVRIAIIAALSALVLSPVQANAAATIQGGPLTNLDPNNASIHLAISNFPTRGGLYIQECNEPVAGARPTSCNAAVQLWISTAQGASFAPTADIIFKPKASYISAGTTIDCSVVKCGIFVRFDHTVMTDVNAEDQFIALKFAAGSVTLPATEEITATLGGITLSSKVPVEFAYRAPATVLGVAKSGAPVTYASLAPACSLTGTTVEALKGSDFCDIAITASGITAHFPLKLIPGTQSISKKEIPATLKVKKSVVLPSKTSFGEKIKYSASGICSVNGTTLRAKSAGTCSLSATAPAKADMWNAFSASYQIIVK